MRNQDAMACLAPLKALSTVFDQCLLPTLVMHVVLASQGSTFHHAWGQPTQDPTTEPTGAGTTKFLFPLDRGPVYDHNFKA